MALRTECDRVARTRQGRAFQTSRTRIGACSGASRRLSTSQRPNWARRDRAAGSLVGPANTSARTASGWVAATAAATSAPNECPSRQTGGNWYAASQAARWSACRRTSYAPRGCSVSPKPGRSGTYT